MYPIFLRIGGLTIYTHGVMTALAFLAGIWLALRHGRKDDLDAEELNELFIYILISSIVGARLFSVLFDGELRWYLNHPLEILKVWEGGLVYYGGFVFAVLASIVFLKVRRIPFWPVSDALAPAISLGQILGRIGCAAAADSWGKPTQVPWAVVYTDPEALAPLNVPLHPTEIYMVLGNVVVFSLLLVVRRYRSFQGQIFLSYCLLYAPVRFLIEYLRDDPRGLWLGDRLSTAQVISIVLFLIGAVFYYARRREAGSTRS